MGYVVEEHRMIALCGMFFFRWTPYPITSSLAAQDRADFKVRKMTSFLFSQKCASVARSQGGFFFSCERYLLYSKDGAKMQDVSNASEVAFVKWV